MAANIEGCQALCSRILDRLQQNDAKILSSPKIGASKVFKTRSTVGIMFSGNVIDGIVFGGPAYNSRLLDKGDIVTMIDKKPVSKENLQAALVGCDLPGTTVMLTVVKASTRSGLADPFNLRHGPVEKGSITREVVLTRMDSDMIADRRQMFELFTALKARLSASGMSDVPVFQDSSPNSCASIADDCIELWTRMLVADQRFLDNVKQIQTSCAEMVEELLEQLGGAPRNNNDESGTEGHIRSTAPADSLPDEFVPKNVHNAVQYELHRSREEIQRLMKCIEDMIPKVQMNNAAAQSLQKESDKFRKENDDLKQEIAELSDRLQATTARMQQEVENAESLLKVLQDHLECTDAAISTLEAQLILLTQELSKAKAEVVKLTEELVAERSKATGLSSENAKLTKIMEASQATETQLNGKLQEVIKQTKEASDKDKEQIASLLAEVDEMKASLSRMSQCSTSNPQSLHVNENACITGSTCEAFRLSSSFPLNSSSRSLERVQPPAESFQALERGHPPREPSEALERAQPPLESFDALSASAPYPPPPSPPPPALAGIGLLIEVARGGRVLVHEVVAGGASARDGRIRVRDQILQVAGVDVWNLGPNDIADLIVGVQGTDVLLKLLRHSAGSGAGDRLAGQPFEVRLVRQRQESASPQDSFKESIY